MNNVNDNQDREELGFGEAVEKAVGLDEFSKISKKIHYPECWDTMAYPTLEDAAMEIIEYGLSGFNCTVCKNDC